MPKATTNISDSVTKASRSVTSEQVILSRTASEVIERLDAAVRFSAAVQDLQQRDRALYRELDRNRAKMLELMLAQSRFRPGQTVQHRRNRVVARIARVEAVSFAESDAELSLYVFEKMPSGRFSRKETWWFSHYADILEVGKA